MNALVEGRVLSCDGAAPSMYVAPQLQGWTLLVWFPLLRGRLKRDDYMTREATIK